MTDDTTTFDPLLANTSQFGLNSMVPNSLCSTNATSGCDSLSGFGLSEEFSSDSDTNDRASIIRGGEAILEIIGFIFIDIIGVIGNTFVLGVVILCKEMRTVANFFIFSLSVADLLVTLVLLPIITATRWSRGWPLSETMCEVIGVVNHASVNASLFNLAAIAVNRFVVTRMPGRYPVLFTQYSCFFYLSIIWVFSILYALLPVSGWGEIKYDETRYTCLFSREAAPSFSIFFAVSCVLLSQVICGVCYVMVLVTFVQSRTALHQLPDVTVSSNSHCSERKLTKNLFVIWIAFFLCWLPIMSLLIIDPKGELDERVYTGAAWLMFANSCVNPIIYGVQNKHFRAGYLKIIKKTSALKKCRQFRIQPVLTATQSRRPRPLSIFPQPGQLGSTGTGSSSSPKQDVYQLKLPDDRTQYNCGVKLLGNAYTENGPVTNTGLAERGSGAGRSAHTSNTAAGLHKTGREDAQLN